MAIPIGNLKGSYDFSNAASYPGTGNTLNDLSLANNDLTNPSLTGTFSGTGQSKYYTFAGGSDQFYRNNSGIAGTQLYTASMFVWTKASSWTDSGYKCIAGWGEDIGTGGGQLAVWKNVAFDPGYQYGMMGSGVAATAFPSFATNTWIHVGYTIDGTTAKLYIDGVEVQSVPQNFYWPSSTGPTGYISNNIAPYYAPITLGGLYDNYYGSAGIDIAICEFYNVGFASTQVLELYNSQSARFGASPPPPPYVGSVGGRRFGGRFAG